MATLKMEHKALPLNKFFWNKNTKTLTAEASDFGPARDGHWWFHRLFDDAADVGISIRSHVTGRIETFYLEREDKDAEGDATGWWFKPSLLRSPAPVKNVFILND